MKLLGIIIISLGLVACGGGDGGSSGGSGGSVDSTLGTYAAEIQGSGGVVLRSFNLLVESDQAATGGVAEDVPFYQLRDGDNIFSRYRHMRNKNAWPTYNMFIESDFETEAANYREAQFDSLADCMTNTAGTGDVYSRILIVSPKFTDGGSGTSMVACKLK